MSGHPETNPAMPSVDLPQRPHDTPSAHSTINYITIRGDNNNTCVQGNQYNNNYMLAGQNRPEGQDVAGSIISPEVERIIVDNSLLLQILGVAAVLPEAYRGIPLISRVLVYTWAQVKEALLKISPYAPFTESELKITMTTGMIKWLANRGEEERRRYHAKVAYWCLMGNWGDDAGFELK
jgi:hypothetical protein